MIPRANWLAVVVAFATVAADQLSKWAILSIVYKAYEPPITITSFFSLVMVWNHGMSFGMLNRPEAPAVTSYAILFLTLLIIGALCRMAWRTTKRLERIGYALTIGGALGNVIDRLHFGAVADFLYFHIGTLGWPAFNVADSAICIGVFILLIAASRNSTVAS
ncbi:MAG: signal peptidase II [Rhodospirillales bacterium 12-54-5]|nr:MAG: signal peptidase II [Rhodospirillales bacterium 12-54-5]